MAMQKDSAETTTAPKLNARQSLGESVIDPFSDAKSTSQSEVLFMGTDINN